MSEEIEELINNLNSSLNFAIKNTLGPYVNKLNANNQRYNAVTNLLKSLPEYKEMENEIAIFNNERQLLCNKINELSMHNDFLLNENNLIKKELERLHNVYNKMTAQFDSILPKADDVLPKADDVLPKADTQNAVLPKANDVLPKTDTENIIEALNNIKAQNTDNDNATDSDNAADSDNAPDSDNAADSDNDNATTNEKMNVGLNVIEKNETVVTDVDDKVKEIYSELKINSTNNVALQKANESASVNTKTLTLSEKEKEIQDIVSELERHLSEEADEDDEADIVTDNEDEDADEIEGEDDTECADSEGAHAEEKTIAQEVAEELVNVMSNDIVNASNDYEDAVSSETAAAEEEEEEELFAIKIPNFKNEFYTSDEKNGDIYEINADDSVGKLLGKFKNGVPTWKTK